MQKKFGGYENKLQLYSAPNENFFFHFDIEPPICEDRRFFRFLSWRVFVFSVGWAVLVLA